MRDEGNPENQGRDLRLAALAGDVDAMIRLLQAGVPVDSADSYGFTPLMLAAKYGHLLVVRLLLEKGAVSKRLNRFGISAIKSAVRRGYEEIVAMLLEAGGNANEVYEHGALLDHAVSARIPEESAARIVRLLLQHGTDPNRTTGGGVNALAGAAQLGKTLVVRELLAGGATFRNQQTYRIALTFTLVQRNPELLRLLEPLEPTI